MRRRKRNNTSLKSLIIIFVISTLTLSVGYSLLYESLLITGKGNLIIEDDNNDISSKYLKCSYTENGWYSGGKYFYQIDGLLENISEYTIENWKIVLKFKEIPEVQGIWNGEAVLNGKELTITPAIYNQSLNPNSSLTIGTQIIIESDKLDIEKIILYGTPIGIDSGEESNPDEPSTGEGEPENNPDEPSTGEGETENNPNEPSTGGGEIENNPDEPSTGGGEIENNPDEPSTGGGETENNPDEPSTGGGETENNPNEPTIGENNGNIDISNIEITLKAEWFNGTKYISQYEFKIANTGTDSIENWKMLIELPEGVEFSQIWGGNYINMDDTLKISDDSYNSIIQPNSTATILIQFESTYQGYVPKIINE